MKLLQCRFYAVLDMRGKVPSRMDSFLSILISRKGTEPRKINCTSVEFCMDLDRRSSFKQV